jgi:quinolinate synthase
MRSVSKEIAKEKLMLESCLTGEELEKAYAQMDIIDDLLRKKNAALFVHYYQTTPIRLLGDVLADSLKLAREGKHFADRDMIVASTVYFMAEMIKILNPDQKVLSPDPTAGCSIAMGMNVPTMKRIREYLPDAKLITYINSNADVKAESDVICTSANASDIMLGIGGYTRIMLPDYYLAVNTINSMSASEKVGRKLLAYKGIEDNQIVLDDVNAGKIIRIPAHDIKQPERARGTCEVHEQFTPEYLQDQRKKLLIDKIIAHPEVSPEVAAVSDMVAGTQAMIDMLRKDDSKTYFVASECSYFDKLREVFPEKKFHTACTLCPYMKKNKLDTLIHSLQNEVYEVTVDPAVAAGARRSLELMFELSR